MVNEKAIVVEFDTRHVNFENGQQFNSLVDQVNAVLKSGRLYHSLKITKWEIYHDGIRLAGDENTYVPFHRHFYYDLAKNIFGGGFMLFEVFEDLRRYYPINETINDAPSDAELVFTVTVTLSNHPEV